MVVYVKPRRNRLPLLVAEYCKLFYTYFLVCGNWQYVKVNSMTCDEIHKWVCFLNNRSGIDILPMKKFWSTKNPSIQGMWHPFYNSQINDVAIATPEEIVNNLAELSLSDTCFGKSAEEELLMKYEIQKKRISE